MHIFSKLVFFFFLSHNIVFATADGPDHFDIHGVAPNDVLWMHPTSDYRSEKIGKIPYNERCLKNLGCTGNLSFADFQKMSPQEQAQVQRRSRWCRVDYRGSIGWVNGKFLKESSHCPKHNNHAQPSYQHITKAMLQNKVFRTQQFGAGLTLKFLLPLFNTFDGDIVFHFDSNPPDDKEVLSYKLINGKIVYYAYDGAKYQLTLLSSNNDRWIIHEEEDVDGDGTKFTFSPAIKKEFKIVHPSNRQKHVQLPVGQSTQEIELLSMQIYGRTDTRIASRRDQIQNIDTFLNSASELLTKKHVLDMRMQEHRQHQMASVGAPPEVLNLIAELNSMENLEGNTLVDHEANKLNMLTQLKHAYDNAAKETRQLQKDNYLSELQQNSDFTKLEKLLLSSGTQVQKNDAKKSEIMRLKGDYAHYKELVDNPSVWCIADRDISQPYPLFYPKNFIIELLHHKYKIELARTGHPFNTAELVKRANNIEVKSNQRKQRFNQEYLYEFQSKIERLKNKF